VARHDERLFRRIIDVSRQHYDRDKATYHVSAEVDKLPAAGEAANLLELEKVYLGRWEDVPPGRGFTEPGRQVLHCTFGTILMHRELAPAIRQLLRDHLDTYTEVLADHFSRHLHALAY
jgi:tagaturonate epimerase